MFFGAEGEQGPSAVYETVLTVARAADRLGFKAIWTPERHFQQVGHVFPNPALLTAALATCTERISLRAGSLLLPLYHPLRVAEDWAVLDNLSHGRIGLSVATGWHTADFVFAPGQFASRRQQTLESIGVLRALSAGEAISFPDGLGCQFAARLQPRPVTADLPLWITTSGSQETWLAAGRMRTHVLAATTGQARESLVQKVTSYREAYRAAGAQAGCPERGTVTLMAHTYVGTDDDEAARTAAAPLRSYLGAHVSQKMTNLAGDSTRRSFTGAQADAMARFGVGSVLAWGSLIGSPDACLRSLRDLREAGCDEVACFVDFGLGRDQILASLHRLAELQQEVAG